MRSLIFVLFISTCSLAMGVQGYQGTWTLTKGTIVNPDGTTRSAAGMKVPYIAEPVGKTRQMIEMLYGKIPEVGLPGENNDGLLRVYQNNRPDNYFGVDITEFPIPSALDDIQISASGVNSGVLDQIHVGWQIPNRNSVFVVFGFYNNYTQAQPPTSAFSGIIVDTFGGPFTADPGIFPIVPGEYFIHFGQTIRNMGITFNDEFVYFFQQFRDVWWLGPFNNEWGMFFSGGGNPQIGNSQDKFWYDFDPQDGTYTDDEQDLFSTEPNHPFQANFALELDIDASVQITELTADTVTVKPGAIVSGNVAATRTSNNIYLVTRPRYTLADYQFPVVIQAVGDASGLNVNSVSITVESKIDIPGAQQQVWMYNYNQNRYVLVDESIIPNTDQSVTFTMGINPVQYVHPISGEMKAMIRVREWQQDIGDFRYSLDQIKWRVGVTP